MSNTTLHETPAPRNSPRRKPTGVSHRWMMEHLPEMVAHVTAANQAARAAHPPMPRCERSVVIASQTFRCQLYAGHAGRCKHSYPEATHAGA